MDRNEIIQKIKVQLKSLLKLADERIKVALEDGTELIIVGSDVALDCQVLNADNSPADNGDYVLNDGRTISVTDGKISNIKEAEEAKDGDESPVEDAGQEMADAPSEEQPAEEKPADDDAAEDEDLAARVEALEAQITEVLSLLQSMGQANQEMMSRIDEFSKAPAEESIKTTKKTKTPLLSQKNALIENEMIKLRKIADRL